MICVYVIQNRINNKIYLGSTFNLSTRINTHLNALKKNIHHSIALQRAYNKYGIDQFDFKIIKLCNKTDCRKIEQLYLNALKPEYNTSLSATAPMEGRKHTIDTLVKFKSRVVLKGIDSPHYGKRLSLVSRKKMSKSRTGLKRTENTRKKMSDTAKRINSIGRINRDNVRKKVRSSDGNIFNSLAACANFYNRSVSSVCDALKGRTKYLNRKYKLEYCG
jgi:group I intron endonuclease